MAVSVTNDDYSYSPDPENHMNRHGIAAIIFLLSAQFPVLAGDRKPGTLEQEIISRIKARTAPVYQKYIGVESTREIVSRQYDSRDNSYRGGYTVLVRRKEYFYKKATYKVLKYVRDGKEEPSWKYNYPTREPVYMPFDPESDNNYIIKLIGKKTIAGIPCWEFDVAPRKDTARHLKGKIYFTISGLNLIFLEGTIADYPIGLQSLAMSIYFKKLDDACVMDRGTYTFTVHVPLFYPYRKFEQTFRSGGDRLIPKEQ